LVIWGAGGSSLAKQRSSNKSLLAFGWAVKVSRFPSIRYSISLQATANTNGPSFILPKHLHTWRVLRLIQAHAVSSLLAEFFL